MTAPARPGLAEALAEVPACGHRLYGACRDCLTAVVLDRLDSDDVREAAAETLSWSSGEMTRYSPDAHPDHNRWSWHGDGHGPATRDEYRKQADTVLAAVRAVLGGER